MSDVYRKFASLKDDQHAYAFDSNQWRSSSTGYRLEAKFRMFQTYGHGLVQHSGDWEITYDHLGDYLASLASYMLEHRDDEELFRAVSYIVLERPRKESIEFAASVVRKESDDTYNKGRYYSLELRKITSSQDKRHDKRFREIDKQHDGGAASILRILFEEKDYADGMERLCYAYAIKEWIDSQEHRWMDHPTILLGWWKDGHGEHEKRVELNCGFSAVKSVCQAHQNIKAAECDLSNYANRLERSKPKPETLQLPAETEAA